MGKHKPIYDPSTDCGDYVVVTGCTDLHVTGKKRAQKLYYSHTTRPGSLKSISLGGMMGKWGGGEVLRRAVRGMLPKNRLRDERMGRLKCRSLRWLRSPEIRMLTWVWNRFRGTRASVSGEHPKDRGGKEDITSTRGPDGVPAARCAADAITCIDSHVRIWGHSEGVKVGSEGGITLYDYPRAVWSARLSGRLRKRSTLCGGVLGKATVSVTHLSW